MEEKPYPDEITIERMAEVYKKLEISSLTIEEVTQIKDIFSQLYEEKMKLISLVHKRETNITSLSQNFSSKVEKSRHKWRTYLDYYNRIWDMYQLIVVKPTFFTWFKTFILRKYPEFPEKISTIKKNG